MSFRLTSTLAAGVCFALAIVLLFFPAVIYWLFQVEAHDTGDFIARRAAMMFAGLSVLTFQARMLLDRQAERAVSIGLAVIMFALAALGACEFLLGGAGPGIWLAIGTELFFTLSYARIWRG